MTRQNSVLNILFVKRLNDLMVSIYFHADDYATSANADQDFIELCQQGKLDSFSIMPNMSCWAQSIDRYKDKVSTFKKRPKVSVHLNFMEGKACAKLADVNLLTDEQGLFCLSWGDLFKASCYSKHKVELREQLKIEIIAQIERVLLSGVMAPDQRLRIDSHQHTHMIPLVYDALSDALDEKGYHVEYIRNAYDPLSIYLRYPSLYATYSVINLIKCIILNTFSHRVQRKNRARNLADNILCGVMFSNNMDLKRVAKVLKAFKEKAQVRNATLEFLFHPGISLSSEITQEFTKQGFIDFHLAQTRDDEKQALLNLSDD